MPANLNFFDFGGEEVTEASEGELRFGQFLLRIAAQLQACAGMQDELAQVLSGIVSGMDKLPSEDIVRLQAIDKSAQMLLDLAAVMSACSHNAAVKDEVVPAEHLAVLKLAEVRRRLLA